MGIVFFFVHGASNVIPVSKKLLYAIYAYACGIRKRKGITCGYN